MKTNNPTAAPSEADIRERAYYLWLDQGCPPNRDQEMWFAAKVLLHDRANEPRATLARTLAAHASDPQHHFHNPALAPDDRRAVARSGALQRRRGRMAKN